MTERKHQTNIQKFEIGNWLSLQIERINEHFNWNNAKLITFCIIHISQTEIFLWPNGWWWWWWWLSLIGCINNMIYDYLTQNKQNKSFLHISNGLVKKGKISHLTSKGHEMFSWMGFEHDLWTTSMCLCAFNWTK